MAGARRSPPRGMLDYGSWTGADGTETGRWVMTRRPSASLVVSVVALIVALSGTAIAASKLVNGDSLIRKGTLSGNRLRRHTLTGTQINVKKLGTVPRATRAKSATTAGTAGSARTAISAQTAASATNAVTAANANELGGVGPSGYLPAGSVIGTDGIVRAAASAAGNTVTLFTDGPLTVTMTCTSSASGTALSIGAVSTEAGSYINGMLATTAGTHVSLTTLAIAATTSPFANDGFTLGFEAPSGAEAELLASDGVNSLGVACWAHFDGIA
jgi:hypothetical protein